MHAGNDKWAYKCPFICGGDTLWSIWTCYEAMLCTVYPLKTSSKWHSASLVTEGFSKSNNQQRLSVYLVYRYDVKIALYLFEFSVIRLSWILIFKIDMLLQILHLHFLRDKPKQAITLKVCHVGSVFSAQLHRKKYRPWAQNLSAAAGCHSEN